MGGRAGIRRLLAYGVCWGLVAPMVPLIPVIGAVSTVEAATCTINWVAGDGSWHVAANWQDVATLANRLPSAADVVCIDDGVADSGPTITITSSISVLDLTNAETVDQASARVTILEGGSITNTGTWKLTDNSDMWGFGGGAGEHFVNSGTLDKATGAGTAFIGTNNVRVDNTGTVRATTGTLDLVAGTWPGTVIDSAAGGVVDIQFDTTSALSGAYDLSARAPRSGAARSPRRVR